MELLFVLPRSTLDGIKALKHAIDDKFDSEVIPSTITELPSRRSHMLRPQVQAVSRALFPDYSPTKQVYTTKLVCGKPARSFGPTLKLRKRGKRHSTAAVKLRSYTPLGQVSG